MNITKSKFNRFISVFLAFALLLSIVNWNAFTAIAEEGYSNTLNEWTVNCWWTMTDGSSDTLDKTDNMSNSDMVEAKLNFSYSIKQAQKKYLPGEFSFSFKGIGGVNRKSMLIGNTIGIDENGNSTGTDKNWDVSYDIETDTYTFVNKIEISKETSQHGGFDLVWSFAARDGVDGYQTEIAPVFTITDVNNEKQTIDMPPLTYQYNSEEDDFKLTVELYPPENGGRVDGSFYETADKNFVWYQYRTKLWQGNKDKPGYDKWKARGLYRSDLFIEIDVEDIIKEYGVDTDAPDFDINDYIRVVNANNKSVDVVKTKIDGKDRWGYYITQDKNGDYNHENHYDYKIAYNQNVFDDQYVEVKAILNRLYNDEEEYRLLRDDADNYFADKERTRIQKYELSYSGYGIVHEKHNAYEEWNHTKPAEGKKFVVDNIYKGVNVEFSIRGCSSKSYSNVMAYSEGIDSDDTAGQENGSFFGPVRRSAPVKSDTGLTEDSAYSMVIGDDELEVYLNNSKKRRLNADEYHFSYLRMPEDKKNHDYTVFVSDQQDPSWDDYVKIGEGNTSTAKYIALGNDVKAFYVRIDGIVGSYDYTPSVGVSFHLDYETEMNKPEEEQVNSTDHIVNYSFMRMLYSSDGTEMDYCGSTDKAYLDNLNIKNEPVKYGCYLLRNYSNVWLRVPKVTLGSRTYWEGKYDPSTSKNIYFISVDTYGTIINTDNIEGELKQFAVYSILPNGFSVTQSSLEKSLTLEASGTDISGLPLTSEEFKNHVRKQELVSLSDGRTAICVTFDFSDRPIEISTLTSVHINYLASISSKFLDAGNHNFTVESRTAILDEGFVVMAKYTDDIYDTNRHLVKDTDNLSGDTSREIAGSYYKDYLKSISTAWNNAAEKQVKTGNDIDYSKSRETDYSDEAEVSAYNPDNPSDDMIYTYELGITVRNIKTNNLVIYDNIETYESVDDGILKQWHGTPLELDTTKIENMNFVPTVYYSENEAQERDLDSDGWVEITEHNGSKWTIPETARSIAVRLGTEKMNGGYYEAPKEKSDQMYVYLKMRSPKPTKETIDKKAYNTCSAMYIQEFENNYTEVVGEYTSVILRTRFYLEKVDESDSDIKLGGAVFEIYENDKTTFVDKVTTNRFGQAEIHGLIFGETYYYKEIESPIGYERNCEGTFTAENANQVITVGNKKMQGAVKLVKYDVTNAGIPIKGGAEYQLFTADGNQVYTDENYAVSESGTVDTFVTDEDSTITITGLSWGVYYFVEVKAPQGYELDSSKVYFAIDKSLDSREPDLKELMAVCKHGETEKTVSLLLKKTDAADGKPLRFAYYQLQRLDSNNKWQTVKTGLSTNAVGEILVPEISFGTYRFKEYNPPAGYELKDESELTESDEIIVNADCFSDDTEVVLKTAQTNERKKGSVMLNKEDKDTGNALNGAIFALYKAEADGNKFIKGGFTTDSYGRLVADPSKDESDIDRFKIQDLEWGDYYFLETKSPKGYEKPTEEYCKNNFGFTVNAATVDNAPTITADNTQVMGSVKLTKVAETDNTIRLEGAKFELLQNGKAVSVRKIDVNVGGTVDSSFYYCDSKGVYYDTPEGKAEIESFVNKTFNYIADPVISIGTQTTELVTDVNGLIEVYDLPWGTYEFHETEAPAGYSKADNIRFVVNSSNCLFQQELECADPTLTCEITIDKVIDACIEDYGNSTFLFTVKQVKDNAGHTSADDMEWTVYITLQYPEKSGSVTLNVPAGEYEITEMPVSRYKPTLIETVKAGTTVSEYTPASSSTNDFKATCTLGKDNSDKEQKFEVRYTNKLTRYDQFSHVTCAENYIAKQKQITGLSLDYPKLIPVDPNGDEDTVYILDKSELEGSFIYDDGSSEPITSEQMQGILTDSGENDFKVHNSLENQGQDFMLRAQYKDPDTGRIFNTAFVVTVDAFDPAAYKKITFTANTNNSEYIGKVGTGANVVFYDEENNVVLGKYMDAETKGGMEFIGWALVGSDEVKLPANIDYNSLPDNTVLEAKFGTVANYFAYKNQAQEFTAKYSGYYEIELWGASGGTKDNGTIKVGRGGYTKGKIYLKAGTKLYIYTGGASGDTKGGYNGGGATSGGTGGGGATDIRLSGGTWSDFNSLKSRIMVAGGAGGSDTYTYGGILNGVGGGNGGGLNGENGHIQNWVNASSYNKAEKDGYIGSVGGSQTAGGYCITHGTSVATRGSFGKGGSDNSYGGGGGGYYGGGSGYNRPMDGVGGYGNSESSGAGGSSFISGYDGCDAIAESSTSGKIVHTGQPNHYSGYVFIDAEMIDGGSEMPAPNGGTETGHMGNGYARITYVGN